MTCKRTLKRLPLFAGGDLDLRAQTEVEIHLQGCLSCYREFTTYRDTIALVRSVAVPQQSLEHDSSLQAGPSLLDGVMEQIDAPPPAAPRLLPFLVTASGWAAALLLGAFLAYSQDLNDSGVERPGNNTKPLNPVTAGGPSGSQPEVVPAVVWSIPDEWLLPESPRGLHEVVDQELLEELSDPQDLTRILPTGALPVSYPVYRVSDY